MEDEFHFVLECQLYQDLRNEYVKKYFWNRPNIPKFIELLQSENKKTIKNLSIYIYKSFKKRNEFLYYEIFFSSLLFIAFLENIDMDKLDFFLFYFFFVRIITLLYMIVNNFDTHSWRWERSSIKLFFFAYSTDSWLLYLLEVLYQGASNK